MSGNLSQLRQTNHPARSDVRPIPIQNPRLFSKNVSLEMWGRSGTPAQLCSARTLGHYRVGAGNPAISRNAGSGLTRREGNASVTAPRLCHFAISASGIFRTVPAAESETYTLDPSTV